jgi:plastocyanin
VGHDQPGSIGSDGEDKKELIVGGAKKSLSSHCHHKNLRSVFLQRKKLYHLLSCFFRQPFIPLKTSHLYQRCLLCNNNLSVALRLLLQFCLTLKGFYLLTPKTNCMKKFVLILFLSISLNLARATQHNVSISGFSYTPSVVNALVGDTVNINTTSLHPTTHVSQATWNANGTTPIAGALFTSQVTSIRIILSNTNTIYYVCDNHVGSSGMKGQINVSPATGVEDPGTKSFGFKVFPNPLQHHSTLHLTLKRPDNISLKIYDATGKLVHTVAVNKQLNTGEHDFYIMAAWFQKGAYIALLQTSEGLIRRRFVVEQ